MKRKICFFGMWLSWLGGIAALLYWVKLGA